MTSKKEMGREASGGLIGSGLVPAARPEIDPSEFIGCVAFRFGIAFHWNDRRFYPNSLNSSANVRLGGYPGFAHLPGALH
jgi:hypothetical protein